MSEAGQPLPDPCGGWQYRDRLLEDLPVTSDMVRDPARSNIPDVVALRRGSMHWHCTFEPSQDGAVNPSPFIDVSILFPRSLPDELRDDQVQLGIAGGEISRRIGSGGEQIIATYTPGRPGSIAISPPDFGAPDWTDELYDYLKSLDQPDE